jgi:arginase family enzyme
VLRRRILVRKLIGQKVIGGDIVEIDAPYDSPSGMAAVLAVQLASEVICLRYDRTRSASGGSD